jgi:predicted TIM-barrel fold metal-dependent hydrolase
MEQKPVGTREDDSWFSEEQLSKLTPADEADTLHSPIPTQMVSNGEYMPFPQTDKQREVEARIKELAGAAAEELGMTRRKFLATGGGVAACFLAMNEVYGRFFNVGKTELFEKDAYAQSAPPASLFVVDDQLHIVRNSRRNTGEGLRAIAQGLPNSSNSQGLPDELGRVNFPWNPALVGLPNVDENFQLVQVVKDIYLDSQVTVGVMSNNTSAAVPDQGVSRPPRTAQESEAGEFLSSPQTMAVRNWVNQIAGSTRMLGHGQMYPSVAGSYPPGTTALSNLDYMQWQIDMLGPDSWKGYTSANSAKHDLDPTSAMTQWRLDDPTVAYPMYDLINRNGAQLARHPGFFNICIHKGLSTNATAAQTPLGHPADIPQAARDWPQFNFVIYHSCIRPGFWDLNALNDVRSGRTRNSFNQVGIGLRDGVPDILWVTEFLVTCAPFSNVYAELGTTFASSVVTFPTVCAHMLGQMLKYFGEDRIVFGSDSSWYGSPQWQIEALWRLQIPDDMRAQFGYPELTDTAKRKILGLNSARLYKLPTAREISARSLYKPVPANYASLIPDSLKTILEYPGLTSQNRQDEPITVADNFTAAREAYQQWDGAAPRNTRYGWLRTKI